MHLTPKEVDRFYNTWFALLHYVNQKRHLVPSFPARWSGASSVAVEVALPLRDAVWADDKLRNAFITENPAQLSADDLALVESWQHRVEGSFFIFRHMTNYTVFLSEEGQGHAYGVLGLMDSFKAMTGPNSNLPIYIKAVLLPFGDRIVYDGLIEAYPVLFGGGMRADMKEQFTFLQEREGVITSLLPRTGEPESVKAEIRARTQKTLKAFQKDLGRAGLTPKMMEEHTSNVASFAETTLLSRNPPAGLLELTRDDLKRYLEATADKPNPVSLKRFLQFLRDTGRMDYDEAEALLRFLKSER